MTIFLTSDQHFYHKNVLDFEKRPFNSMEEMNEGLINAWNSVVRKTDTVYCLGDFCFGNVKQWMEILNQLRGNIILIKGNHDKTKIVNRVLREGYIQEYHPLGTVLKVEGMILNLSHYPIMIGNRPRNFSIHGHLHSDETASLNNVNIGIDSLLAKQIGNKLKNPFGTPIELDEIVSWLEYINPHIEEIAKGERM